MWYFWVSADNGDWSRRPHVKGSSPTGLRCAFEVCTLLNEISPNMKTGRSGTSTWRPVTHGCMQDVCTMNVHVQHLAFIGGEMTILRCLFLGLLALVWSLFRTSTIVSLAVALLLAREQITVIDCFHASCHPCADLAQPSRDQILEVVVSLASDSSFLAQVSNVSGRQYNRICTCPSSGRAQTPRWQCGREFEAFPTLWPPQSTRGEATTSK
jgi:hypothetical protein